MTMVFRGRHQLDAHRRLRPERDDLVLVVDGVVEAFLAVDAEPPVAPRHLATLRAGQALPGTGWAGELGPGEHVELLGNGTATVRLLPP
ncbi:MAG TPA: hypothetical protein VJT31_24110, partial [Rugosimonospora sp.]|nr:hypothetical protein [Rugosimonospora sp.]